MLNCVLLLKGADIYTVRETNTNLAVRINLSTTIDFIYL